jgi:methylenetetrahydrofolate reductase (NADPH)
MITLSRLQTLFTDKHFGQLPNSLTTGHFKQLTTKKSSGLQTLFTVDRFVLSAELTPPRHYKMNAFADSAEKIAPYVDIVQVNDNTMAQARLSTLVAAHFMQRSGLEPVIQLTLRHRNRIALQSDLLGLAALDLRNVIVLSGSPCSIGTDPEAKDATDISTINAIAALNRLTRHGQLFNGQTITPPPDFYIGAISTPVVADLDASMAQLTTKIDSGAKYIQLQAIFELDAIEQWMAEVRARGLHKRAHFMAAIYPFSCLKSLERLRQIPQMNIPDRLMARLSNSRNSRSESLKVNFELIKGIRAIEGIRGLHLRAIPPRDWMPRFSELLRTAVDQVAV